MKVLLLQNVRKVGHKGEIVEVKEGYGRNFLVQKGLAKEATPAIIKESKNKKEQSKKAEVNTQNKEEEILQTVNKKSFEMKVNASDKGHLFAGIHTKEISKITNIPEKNIVLEKDIKEVGEYEIKLKFGTKKGKIKLSVVAN